MNSPDATFDFSFCIVYTIVHAQLIKCNTQSSHNGRPHHYYDHRSRTRRHVGKNWQSVCGDTERKKHPRIKVDVGKMLMFCVIVGPELMARAACDSLRIEREKEEAPGGLYNRVQFSG